MPVPGDGWICYNSGRKTEKERDKTMDKRIKTPMIIGIIIQGVALLIGFVCYLIQDGIASMQRMKIGERVFPETLIQIAVILMFYIIILLVMQTYEGGSRRLVAGVLAAIYCVIGIVFPIILRITTIFDSRKGVEFLAAKNTLAAVISLFTSPLNVVSLVLVLIALGRYGVLDQEQS